MFKNLILFTVVAGIALLGYMYSVATSDPVVRTAQVVAPDWPENAAKMKLLLVSDVHVAGPDMPPERLAQIVEKMNKLGADMIMFAGDFVSDKRAATTLYSAEEALAPLKKLKADQGIDAVLGNHDHWRNTTAISKALKDASITILTNEAMQVGPIALGADWTTNSLTVQTPLQF